MEVLGSVLLILSVAILVILFVTRPILRANQHPGLLATSGDEKNIDHLRSSLLAERDHVLNTLYELEFDNTLGKVPEEDYLGQRVALVKTGADILRRLEELRSEPNEDNQTAEDWIEAAVAARRTDSAVSSISPLSVGMTRKDGRQQIKDKDPLEDLIASRRRQREEKSAGFCPGCGKAVQVSDRYCPRCGTSL